ncbi:glucose-6-phosphate 1-epimerase [Nitrosospira sp. Nl5]|uniref:D-hexose-6-phosphate mutarotase n=1 Tax=Nitrosospira sp. Nl5 TaxID=200120 RepID=UPI000881AA6C|nr:D-hexose-6-phosphate mutarotase [Nitrosospira sp. Nl5]SCY09219.1 glucose-6-phosphate 1-epimerase [Nitrosospira sp. Nl5]
MNIEQLNTDHGITDQLKFVEGAGGLPFIQIDNAKARAVISVYAGQVLSFQPVNEPHDLMFLSEAAYYQPGKAIKGGTPICWPWFGPDPEAFGRPAHGFVRNRFWNVIRTETKSDGDVRVTLGLTDTPETRAIWPHSFVLALEITVGDSLNLELITRNTGKESFSITQALHTYFKVEHIGEVVVLGLEDTEYIDKADNGARKLQKGAVTIKAEVDRIYRDAPDELVIDDTALDRRIRIASRGSKTAVVWNPWAKIAAEMGDLKDDDYKRLLCVETANAASDVAEVGPRGEFRLAANYRIERYVPDVLKRIKELF